MQRTSGIAATVVLVLVAAATPALGDMWGTFSDSYGSSNGGEFIFTPSGDYNGLTLGPFPTFCIEVIEYIDFSRQFHVDDISSFAVEGGFGGGNPDPLDARTAWLYQSFRDQSLSDYGYVYDIEEQRVASANALQNVIWGLEGELGDSWTPAAGMEATFLAAAEDADPVGLGNVRVLNISWPNRTPAQSQLVIVPVPGAVILGIVGLGIVGLARRRFT